MIALATAIFAVLTDEGPIPVFHVDTPELCAQLLEISLTDAQCVDIGSEEETEDEQGK